MHYPRRPPRLPMLHDGQRPLFFVTCNTHFRKPLLANPGIHSQWLRFAERAAEHGAWVGRYTILPDHLHLFVWIGEMLTLEKWVQSLRAVLGKELLRQGMPKPHWQPGFFDHLLRSQESYGDKWEYVRQNPVRKGLCTEAEQWPYQGEINYLDW